MKELAMEVQPWDSGGFVFVQKLQDAARNHGSVDIVQSINGGVAMAAKRMPNRWVTAGPVAFKERHPKQAERPWQDIGLLCLLNRASFPYCCKFMGLYRDTKNTYVLTSLATCGDLFSWSHAAPEPGAAREALMQPITVQVFAAVRWLHELGVAHRDLSLENVLLVEDRADGVRVQLIDFAMATLERTCTKEVRGKPSYQAPEMHTATAYDSFLADCFALGVLLYSMAVRGYPWVSTKPGSCPFFEYVIQHGLHFFMSKRTLREDKDTCVAGVISPGLANVISGLLELEPTARLTLAESCFANGSSRSAWEKPWLQGLHGAAVKL
jgi:serine/threonine protein kinase